MTQSTPQHVPAEVECLLAQEHLKFISPDKTHIRPGGYHVMSSPFEIYLISHLSANVWKQLNQSHARKPQKFSWVSSKFNQALGSPMMNSPTKFELNPVSVLSANAQKCLGSTITTLHKRCCNNHECTHQDWNKSLSGSSRKSGKITKLWWTDGLNPFPQHSPPWTPLAVEQVSILHIIEDWHNI